MPDYERANRQRKKLSKIFFDDDRLEFLADKYTDEYAQKNNENLPPISKKNLIYIIKWTTRYILQCFNLFEPNYNQHWMNQIKLLKILDRCKLSEEDVQKLSNAPRTVYFSRQACVAGHITHIFEQEGLTEKNPEAYTELCSKITHDLIIEITNYIYNALPEEVKANEGLARYGLIASTSSSSSERTTNNSPINTTNQVNFVVKE